MFLVCPDLSWVLKLDDSALTYLVVNTKPRSLAGRSGRNGLVSLSQPPKCIQLTPHEAPELAKIQVASPSGVR